MEWNRWQTSREPPATYRPFNQGPHVCSRASEGLCVIRLQMTQLLFHLGTQRQIHRGFLLDTEIRAGLMKKPQCLSWER